MAEGLTGAGDFELEVLDLVTVSGMRIDLTASCMGITIFEDVFSLALTGTIALTDSFNLPSHGPILGQEYLYLKIRTPSFPNATTTAIDFSENVFLVHSISTRKALGSGVQGYVLSFASQELIKNQRLKVTQSLTGSWSDLVEQMLRDNKYLNTTKNVLIERTAGVKRFVAPNIRPLDVVVLATKQAISQKGGEPTFLFYETFDGFNFRSLASLYNKLPSFLFKTVQFGSNPPLGRRGDIAKQMETILSYEIVNNNDTIVGYRTGMYGSKLITHDIVKKKIVQHEYTGFNEWFGISHLGIYPPLSNSETEIKKSSRKSFAPPATEFPSIDETELSNQVDSHIEFYPKHNQMYSLNTSDLYDNKVEDWKLQRNGHMEIYNGLKVMIECAGVSFLKIGSVVNLLVTSPETTDRDGKMFEGYEKYLSGKWLVSEIRHILTQKDDIQYRMVVILLKDGLEDIVPLRKTRKED